MKNKQSPSEKASLKLQHESSSISSQQDSPNCSFKSQPSARLTAIVLAGKRNASDPVASLFGQQSKALIPILGWPMVQHVVTSLCQSSTIKRIVIVFDNIQQMQTAISTYDLPLCSPEILIVPCADSISTSILKAIDSTHQQWPYLVTTADHPLLTQQVINEFSQQASSKPGVTVGLVNKDCIEAAYPQSKRTYLPFRDIKVSGANLFILNDNSTRSAIQFWQCAETLRKKPWRLFVKFGFSNVLGLLLRRYTLHEAFSRITSTIGCNAQAVVLAHAEAAIDVDRPHDVKQVESILVKRSDDMLETITTACKHSEVK